ncbi:MAG TPA: site-specific integrase [Solirubrobacteraceae bacterium]
MQTDRSPGKRAYGTGLLFIKYGAYYGRWRAQDGRRLGRKIGPVRSHREPNGLTRPQAEKRFRALLEHEERRPTRRVDLTRTVDHAADSLRGKLRIEGARTAYLRGCESMQRVHIRPFLGDRLLAKVTTAEIDAMTSALLETRKPKTVRMSLTFLGAVFQHAIEQGWCEENPARRAVRPRRMRERDSNPDLQFLTLVELEAVLRAIPDHTVCRVPAPTREGRPGSAPPVPPDVLGPVLRRIVLTAALTGLRRSELLGLRWRDIDWAAQRIRVRNTYVLGEHSGEGKSDRSTRRSVPIADRLLGELDAWSRRTAFDGENDLVFAHPQTGKPLDGSKVTKKFQAACAAGGVRPVRFHDLRHTFATCLAASGQPLRTIQEFLGHADMKTTQIYAHYAPCVHEVEMVNTAFSLDITPDERAMRTEALGSDG